MIWLVVFVGGLIVVAVAFDIAARARGRYRPAGEWERARLRRKSQAKRFRDDRHERRFRANPEDRH